MMSMMYNLKFKRFITVLLLTVITAIYIPVAMAEEYYDLRDVASANGYEYFYFDDKKTANLRSASYILAFRDGINIVSYKTVLGDQGIIELNDEVKLCNGNLAVSAIDLQTKLIKFFPNLWVPPYLQNDEDSETDYVDTGAQGTSSQPSEWAASEVERAVSNGLVTYSVSSNYQANITREQFCGLVVKLYEKMTGNNVITGDNKFTDTSNQEVLKAYTLGIVNGISDTEFGPRNLVTRQEICVMLVRAIGIISRNTDLNDYQECSFSDADKIASWAVSAVQFAYDKDIIRGVSSDKIDPLGNTTCEQAVLFINRIYDMYSV